jgi:hypothetical protein
MTGALSPAPPVCEFPCGGLAGALLSPHSWSQDGRRVSQPRDSSQEIQSRMPDGQMRRGMIGAMYELRHCVPPDRSADTSVYTSAAQPVYTLVYTNAKEVSGW